MSDMELISALIGQVSRAMPEGKSERDVTTIITRPMWEAWCRATDIPEGAEPSEWIGPKETRRVYGSWTKVVESEVMMAVSFAS